MALVFGLYKYGYQKSKFVFIISILVLSCFQYGNAQGGMFNISAFLVLLISALNTNKYHILKNPDKFINLLVVILMIFNFTGLLLKSEIAIFDKSLGAVTFLGYIFVFNISSRFLLNSKDIRILLKILVIIVAYGVLLSINKYFNFIHFQSPLFGGEGRYGSSNLGGTFGPSPIFGEFGLLVYVFLLPFILSDLTKENYKLNFSCLVIGIFAALSALLLAASRSTIILGIFATVLFIVLSFFIYPKVLNRKVNFILIVIIIFIIISTIGPRLNIDYVISRFELINPEQISIKTIQSGEEINRATAFKIGREILSRENWIIGYGWGTLRSNRIAWFNDPGFYRSDPHSLYYSLPPLFGWVGSFVFILIFIVIIYRLVKITLLNSYISPLFLSWLGFAMSLVFFLINEYKITALSNPHYLMIIWIWLGLSNSLILQHRINKTIENP